MIQTGSIYLSSALKIIFALWYWKGLHLTQYTIGKGWIFLRSFYWEENTSEFSGYDIIKNPLNSLLNEGQYKIEKNNCTDWLQNQLTNHSWWMFNFKVITEWLHFLILINNRGQQKWDTLFQ